MRERSLFIWVSGLQFIVSIVLVLYTFGAGMARFDSGAAASLPETIAGWLIASLSFPLLTALHLLNVGSIPGLWGYLVFAANAAIWGVAAVALRRRWHRLAASRQ
jgi:hypothetical protein